MRKVVISGMIGNALEWYDYALYAQFSSIIAKLFFPSDDHIVSMIATFGVFSVGFIVRPLGAVLFGFLGDRYGRRFALSAAILLMSIPTGCIGILPSYDSIGIWAPILLTVIRIFQGLSLGGEFSGCIAYIVEHSSVSSRGLAGSSSFVSMCIGILLGSLTAVFLSSILSVEDLESWGWRIPFILGVFIGVVGLYIRLNLSESPVYEKAKLKGDISDAPISEISHSYLKPLFLAMGLYFNVTIPFYIVSIFINSFMQTSGYLVSHAVLINCISLLILITIMPLSAYISDFVGRKKVLIAGTFLNFIFAYPVFYLLNQGGYILPLVSQILLSFSVAVYMGPMPTTLVELFPTRVRFTGVAISYNLIAGLFGGTAPMFSFWLIRTTGSLTSVAFYIMAAAAITAFSLVYFKETYHNRI